MPLVTTKIIEHAEQAAKGELREWLERQDYKAAAAHCLKLPQAMTGKPENLLINFFLILWFIENNSVHSLGTSALIKELARGGELMLKYCEINPFSSKFSDLYGRLYRSASHWTSEKGDPWMDMWLANIGQSLSSSANLDEALSATMFAADRAFRLGYITGAAGAYLHVEYNATEQTRKAAARLGRMRCLRLLGEIEHALNLATSATFEYEGMGKISLEFEWQERLCTAYLKKQIDPLLLSMEPKSPFYQADYALSSALLAFSLPDVTRRGKVKRASTYKANFAQIVKGSYEFDLYKMLLALESIHNNDEDMLLRLKQLGEDLSAVRDLGMIEEKLIFFAGAIRWLRTEKLQSLVDPLINEYSGLCLRLSAGRLQDVLGLIERPKGNQELIDGARFGEMLPALPITSNKLLLKMSGLAAKATLACFKDKKKSGSKPNSAAEEISENHLGEMFKLIAEEIGSFNGPVMKMSQLLAAGQAMPALPPLSFTRAVAPEIFFKLFRAEQGHSIQQTFRNVQKTPLGVGSMGQVFRAECRDGTAVAIKIHYPDIEKIVRDYERASQLFLMVLRQVFPGIDVDATSRLITSALLDECDMHKEAIKHQFMYDTFHGRDNLIVPRVFHEFTSPAVLVTEYIPGLSLFEFVSQASALERQKYAHAIETVFDESISKHGYLSIDPHGGNYLYSDGKVVCLDFGTLLKISPDSVAAWQDLFSAIKSGDDRRLFDACVRQKVMDQAHITEDIFLDMIVPLLVQFRHRKIDQEKRHFMKFFAASANNRNLRHTFIVGPEVALIIFSCFFYLTLRDSIETA